MTGLPTLAPRHWAALYLLAAVVGVVLLAVAAPRPHAPEDPSGCRPRTEADRAALQQHLERRDPDILTLDLAGHPRVWASQLQGGAPLAAPGEQRASCAEWRAGQLRAAIEQFDEGLFIPLYAVLSLLVVGWVTSGPPLRRVAWAAAAGLVFATAALVVLDRQENSEMLSMIGRMEVLGVASVFGKAASFDAPDLVAAAHAARGASLAKWAASAAWAAALALALALCLREARARLAARWPRAGRVAAALPVLAMAVAALLFAFGAMTGSRSAAISLPAAALEAAMAASAAGMAGAALLWAAACWLIEGAAPGGPGAGAPPPMADEG
ncbi:MAG: hypothetical protein JNL30_13005 [Rubrivivax sp.]|nr:hypothetical protein [Rubrivivax sp.]